MEVKRFIFGGTVYTGAGARKSVVDVCVRKRFSKALVVTDRGLSKLGIATKVTDILDEGHIPYQVFQDVEQNPSVETIQNCSASFLSSGADCIIAVGGGSVIDTAKAVSVIASNPQYRDVISLEGVDKSLAEPLPLIAVPTTSGTGSEVTMDYVITNRSSRRKFSCMDSKAVPVASILDTDILVSLPIRLTAATAMDALTHAIESYISVSAWKLSELFSLESIRLISESFTSVISNPSDPSGRGDLALAALLAGTAFTNVGLGLVHAMAHPLSAWYGIPHGEANALLLPHVLAFNRSSCVEKYDRLTQLFAADPVETLRGYNTAAGLPTRLSETAARKQDIPSLSTEAVNDVAAVDNPRNITETDVRDLYESLF